jgi:hypothetical protein
MLETSHTIIDQNFSILIDLGDTERFISSVALKRIKVKEFEKDEFRYVEMASRAEHKVGLNIMDCSINLGDFVINSNLYVMILGSYDIVIGMDWLEWHDAIHSFKTKQLSLMNDLG